MKLLSGWHKQSDIENNDQSGLLLWSYSFTWMEDPIRDVDNFVENEQLIEFSNPQPYSLFTYFSSSKAKAALSDS